MTTDEQDTYVHDRTPADQARLRRIAGALNARTRSACARAGLGLGQRAIDVGCGPVGALPILAELVGPTGAVVGMDASAEALAQARATLDQAGLTAVALVQADINAGGPDAVAAGMPFDLAVCRLVLMHQADPAATLRAVARLVRPGGRIVAIDQVFDPDYPRCDPPVPAVARVFALHAAHMRSRGATPDVAWQYADLCAAAGVQLVDQQGFFTVHAADASIALDITPAILLTQRAGLVAAGLTDEGEIQALVAELDAARGRGLRLSTSPLFCRADRRGLLIRGLCGRSPSGRGGVSEQLQDCDSPPFVPKTLENHLLICVCKGDFAHVKSSQAVARRRDPVRQTRRQLPRHRGHRRFDDLAV